MARKDTFWGAYDISLETELKSYVEKMKEIGIKNPKKLEASLLVAEKAKRQKLTPAEIRRIISKRKGL